MVNPSPRLAGPPINHPGMPTPCPPTRLGIPCNSSVPASFGWYRRRAAWALPGRCYRQCWSPSVSTSTRVQSCIDRRMALSVFPHSLTVPLQGFRQGSIPALPGYAKDRTNLEHCVCTLPQAHLPIIFKF